MSDHPNKNPLLQPVRDALGTKRRKKTGTVPRSWILVLLRILDEVGSREIPVNEDDLYTYDFTLKKSRANAIPQLLRKHGFPIQLGMGHEGVTTRGAPGLRFFRAIHAGQVLQGRPNEEKEALVKEAIEVLRHELNRTLDQNPVQLANHAFDDSGSFVAELLHAVENRSNGRVEQALVGAKLQLRYPNEIISAEPAFAGDAQTHRECDFTTGDMRIIVSVTPKEAHFNSAIRFARERKQVFLVVAEKSFNSARKHIADVKLLNLVRVATIQDYVAGNMAEIAREQKITPHEMCMKLVAEYNKRIVNDYDPSLQVESPGSAQ